MADINYNEATHSIVYTQDGASVCPGPDPMFHWDVRFPERLSRLHLTSDLAWTHHPRGACLSPLGRRQHRRARADRSGAAGRYRTQPITFDEIAEVDEDGSGAGNPSTAENESASSAAAATGMTADDAVTGKDSKAIFKHQMSGFSRSMDGLVTGYMQRAATGAVLTGSDKENTPCDADAKPTHFMSQTGATSGPAAGSADHTGSGEPGGSSAGSDDVTSAAVLGFQMPAISDISRQRRKRSNRKLRNRNSVPEEVILEQRGDDGNVSS